MEKSLAARPSQLSRARGHGIGRRRSSRCGRGGGACARCRHQASWNKQGKGREWRGGKRLAACYLGSWRLELQLPPSQSSNYRQASSRRLRCESFGHLFWQLLGSEGPMQCTSCSRSASRREDEDSSHRQRLGCGMERGGALTDGDGGVHGCSCLCHKGKHLAQSSAFLALSSQAVVHATEGVFAF